MTSPDSLLSLLQRAPAGPAPWFRREIPLAGPGHLADGLPGPAFRYEPRDGSGSRWGAGRLEFPSLAGETDLDGAVAGLPGEVRIWGGLAFDENSPRAPEWKAHGGRSFWIPRVEWGWRAGVPFVAVHGELDSTELAEIFRRWNEKEPELPRETSERIELPSAAGWRSNVETILSRIRSGGLRKAVLARRTEGGSLPGARGGEGNTRFEFRLGGGRFIGASPEILFQREGRRLYTEALAATRRRGEDRGRDDALAEELLAAGKDGAEHGLVRDDLRGILSRWSARIEESAVAVRRYATVQHLHVGYEARLDREVGSGEILTSLHPTPAVGLSPRSEDLSLIGRLEGFDRGWYGGAVGWMARDGAEFAVAIRAALVVDSKIYRYAGAGIVEGSDAEKEWDELNAKRAGIPV